MHNLNVFMYTCLQIKINVSPIFDTMGTQIDRNEHLLRQYLLSCKCFLIIMPVEFANSIYYNGFLQSSWKICIGYISYITIIKELSWNECSEWTT